MIKDVTITKIRVRLSLLPLPARHLVGLPMMMRLLIACVLLLPSASQAANISPRELLDGGRLDEALQLLTPQAKSGNAAALNYLGRAYFALEDWDNAAHYCERATHLDPRNAEFQLWLGRSYGEKANSAPVLSAYSLARKTVAAFETARALDRDSLPIAHDLAEYYAAAPSIVGGGSGKALALAAELVRGHPSDAAWVRAMVASHEGNYQNAEHEYNESIRLDHGSAATYLEFARYLKGHKDWVRFQQTVELAVQSRRIAATDRYNLAELLLSTNRDLPLAAKQMRAYIQSSHTVESAPLFRAHFLLGEILLKSGDNGQAAAEFRAALALASSYRPAVDSLRRLGQR